MADDKKELIPEIPKSPEDVIDSIKPPDQPIPPSMAIEEPLEAGTPAPPQLPAGMAGIIQAVAANPGLANLASSLVNLANTLVSRGQNDRVARLLEIQDYVMMQTMARQTVGSAIRAGVPPTKIKEMLKGGNTDNVPAGD